MDSIENTRRMILLSELESDNFEYQEKIDNKKMRYLFGSVWDLTGIIVDVVIEMFNDEVTWNRWRAFYLLWGISENE